MGSVFRQIAVMGLLRRVSTPDPNDVLPRGVRSRVKTDGDAHQVGINPDQSQAATEAADVESERPVDKSHFT